MEFWLKIENNKIIDAKFTTDGCENSIICGSAAGYMLPNKNLDEAASISQEQVLQDIGYLADEFKHCALLAVNTIKKAIEDYKITCQENIAANNQCDNNCGTCCTKDSCSSAPKDNQNNLQRDIEFNGHPSQIKHKIAVLSGKGGVGKSTIAANLAITLASSGYKVGLLDVDIHGPSIPTLLDLKNVTIQADQEGIIPVEVGKLKVLSIGFFLENNDDALIWRGPLKTSIINQFLHEVNWGFLDFLVIDLPPGTGDEPLSIGQSFSSSDGAVVVTTPQEMAMADVRKSINFCRKLELPILGIIENMSGFICPKCNETSYIFGADGGETLSKNFSIPLLGKIPLDPTIVSACDKGLPYIDAHAENKTAKIFKKVVDTVVQHINNNFSTN